MNKLRKIVRARPFIDGSSVKMLSMRPLDELLSWKKRIINSVTMNKLKLAIELKNSKQNTPILEHGRKEIHHFWSRSELGELLGCQRKVVQVEAILTGEKETWTIHNGSNEPKRFLINMGTALAQLFLNSSRGEIIKKPNGQEVRIMRCFSPI